MDSGYPTGWVSNCIHAISDVAFSAFRLRVGTAAFGEVASYLIVRRMRRSIIDIETTHDWLISELGLSGHPITRKSLDEFSDITLRR